MRRKLKMKEKRVKYEEKFKKRYKPERDQLAHLSVDKLIKRFKKEGGLSTREPLAPLYKLRPVFFATND